jgi:HAD superfamily hydrolase (TIGR01490 family)
MAITSSEHKNNKGPSYLVFFDLDRTIAGTVSGKAIAEAACRKGLLKGTDLLNALFNSFAFKSGIRSQIRIINDMVGWVRGIHEDVLISLCSEIFRDTVLPRIYSEVKPEIESHKARMAKVVILSSSLEPLCSLVAGHLCMDDVICTRLEVVNGLYTGRTTGIPCFGNGKVTSMKEYCEKNNSNPRDAWYYGDSKSDIPVLSSVGYPVCINPDRKLKKKAIEKKWPVYFWS